LHYKKSIFQNPRKKYKKSRFFLIFDDLRRENVSDGETIKNFKRPKSRVLYLYKNIYFREAKRLRSKIAKEEKPVIHNKECFKKTKLKPRKGVTSVWVTLSLFIIFRACSTLFMQTKIWVSVRYPFC